VDHVRKGLPPFITGADAMAALRISVAANRSLREGRPVDIEELEA
jgi:predicted dehydrogenase